MLTIEELVNMHIQEKQTKRLAPVPDTLYKDIVELISSLAVSVAQLKTKNAPEEEIKDAEDILGRVRSFASDILQMRRRKILNELFIAISISTDKPEVEIPNMTPEEKVLVDAIANASKMFNADSIKRILEASKIPEVVSPEVFAKPEFKEKKEIPIVLIMVTDPAGVGPLVDESNFPYPYVPAGTLMTVPLTIAEEMINNGKAVLVYGGA